MKVLQLLALSCLLTSCASIVSESTYSVTFDSQPSGASVTVRDSSGQIVHSGRAPTAITLDADSGFFSRANYDVEMDLPGYAPARTRLSGKLDGWYWGNILFGGLIGMLIVDPATGAMWKLPARHEVQLTPGTP